MHSASRLLPQRKLLTKKYRVLLESLEPRTLLSVTIVSAKSATFTDVDGDLVTVAVSKGALTSDLFITAPSGQGEQLQELDLSAAGFSGANLTISVQQSSGDGLTNVGYINATGNSLGKVSIAGDLGRIDATGAKGISSLTINSLGDQGTNSQQAGGTLISNITSLGALSVTNDINKAFVNVSRSIKSVNVGGSLIGGTDANSGSIQASDNIGNVVIGHDVVADTNATSASDAASIAAKNGSMGNVTISGSAVGGAALDSAEIWSSGKMGKVSIGGNLVGGDGNYSAEIEASKIASVNVTGFVIGGDGDHSGSFLPDSIGNVVVGGSLIGGSGIDSGSFNPISMGNITIGGSVIGGDGSDSGAIYCQGGNLGKVVITQNLIGGNSSDADPTFTGYIESTGKITSIFIGGNLIAGTSSAGGLLESGSIRAGTTIGSVQINGIVSGSDTQPAVIAAGGKINTILLAQNVNQTQILAGYTTDPDTSALTPFTDAGTIGKITVNGNWVASTVMAGTEVGPDTLPGTADDTPIPGHGAGRGSIGAITITGQVFDNDAGDRFGFIASKIGSFSANGTKAPLTRSKDNLPIPNTHDGTILEV